MNILLIEGGLFESARSILAALIDEGHSVYVVPAPGAGRLALRDDDKMRLAGAQVDLVLTFDWELVRPDLAWSVNDDFGCPLVNVVYDYPPLEILDRFTDVTVLTTFFADHRIRNWIMCEHALREYELCGLTHAFFQPWGIYERVIAPHVVDAPDCYGHFLSAYDPATYAAVRELDYVRAWIRAYQQDEEAHREHGVGRVIYRAGLAAVPPAHKAALEAMLPKVDRERLRSLAIQGASACQEAPSASRLDALQATFGAPPEALFDLEPNVDRNTVKLGLFHLYFVESFSAVIRQTYVRALHQAFGDDVVVYGDEWARLGIPSRRTSDVWREPLYALHPVSLDCGSLSFETCLYPRSCEIVKKFGCLLQLERPDSAARFPELTEFRFSSVPSMVEAVRTYAYDQVERTKLAEATYRRFAADFNFIGIVRKVVASARP